jgi:hypothetical protein
MGKYLGITIGGAAAFFGLLFLIAWWADFLVLLRGTIPAIILFAGVIAIFAGVSELKDTFKSKKTKAADPK